jgi:hypothetical protein
MLQVLLPPAFVYRWQLPHVPCGGEGVNRAAACADTCCHAYPTNIPQHVCSSIEAIDGLHLVRVPAAALQQQQSCGISAVAAAPAAAESVRHTPMAGYAVTCVLHDR